MKTKLSELKKLWAEGDRVGALRIAARFPNLGEHRERITRGWAAHLHPETYRDMGYDPETLVKDAFKALTERYELPG